jgi:hypothetical protein
MDEIINNIVSSGNSIDPNTFRNLLNQIIYRRTDI